MNEQPTGGGGKKNNVLFVAIIGVILLMASFLIGLTVGMKSVILPGGTAAGCDEAALLQRLADAGYLPPDLMPGAPIYELEGTISSVGSDYIEVTSSLTPLDDPATFRVKVGPETSMVLLTRKDSIKFQEEMDAFDRAIEDFDPETDSPPEPPIPYEEKVLNLSELKQGMVVSVLSGDDIRANPSFVATEITAEEVASAEEPPAETPPVEEPPAETPPVEEPPTEDLPTAAPPIEEPPVE